jgi:bacterioferritin
VQGDPRVVELLNEVLANELTATSQYYLHYAMQKNWGFTKLADYTYGESIDEMKHADRLMERILFLEGLPNLQDLGRLMIGENAKEALESDLKLEQAARPTLQEGIAHCETVKDYISREILEEILESEEEHIDWLETQLGLIESLGMQNWLQSQAGGVS